MLDEQKVDLSTFGKRLTYSIKISGLKRRDITVAAGIPADYLIACENDLVILEHFEVRVLAEAIKTSPHWLVFGTHEKVTVV
jgi:hypothetical protein